MAKKPQAPEPNIITAAGNVNFNYQIIGVVMSVVAREEAGCGGGLPVGQALAEATADLKRQAVGRGANGLIHISYMHRVSTSQGCGTPKANIEVYAWGTAVIFANA